MVAAWKSSGNSIVSCIADRHMRDIDESLRDNMPYRSLVPFIDNYKNIGEQAWDTRCATS